MLFDCGEDAQRQLLKQPQIVHGRVNRIFVTSNSSENIYGIPGKLPVFSAALLRVFGLSQDLHVMSLQVGIMRTRVHTLVSRDAAGS